MGGFVSSELSMDIRFDYIDVYNIYNMVMLCQYCNTSKKCRSNFHQCPLIQL